MYAMNENNSQSSTVIPATTKKRRISTADKLNTMRAMILAGKYMEEIMEAVNVSEGAFYRLVYALSESDNKVYKVRRSPQTNLTRPAKISPEGTLTVSAGNIAILGLSEAFAAGRKVAVSRDGNTIVLTVLADAGEVAEKDTPTAPMAAASVDGSAADAEDAWNLMDENESAAFAAVRGNEAGEE